MNENKAASMIGTPSPEQQREIDLSTAQALRSAQIVQERNHHAQLRAIAAARIKQEDYLAQRDKENQDRRQIDAVLQESAAHDAALQKWLSAGGYASDFEKQWSAQWQRMVAEKVAQADAQLHEKYRALF